MKTQLNSINFLLFKRLKSLFTQKKKKKIGGISQKRLAYTVSIEKKRVRSNPQPTIFVVFII